MKGGWTHSIRGTVNIANIDWHRQTDGQTEREVKEQSILLGTARRGQKMAPE